MTNTSTALKRHLLAPAVLMLSILLSAQALALSFDEAPALPPVPAVGNKL